MIRKFPASQAGLKHRILIGTTAMLFAVAGTLWAHPAYAAGHFERLGTFWVGPTQSQADAVQNYLYLTRMYGSHPTTGKPSITWEILINKNKLDLQNPVVHYWVPAGTNPTQCTATWYRMVKNEDDTGTHEVQLKDMPCSTEYERIYTAEHRSSALHPFLTAARTSDFFDQFKVRNTWTYWALNGETMIYSQNDTHKLVVTAEFEPGRTCQPYPLLLG